MFIGEHDSESLTEFESRDVTFLENDFPQQGDINKDLSFYETMDFGDQDSLHSNVSILGNMFPTPSANDNDLDQNRSNPNESTQTTNVMKIKAQRNRGARAFTTYIGNSILIMENSDLGDCETLETPNIFLFPSVLSLLLF